MPDTFEINQGARIIFSIVSFPFLSLFREFAARLLNLT
jgi:hypothetical protein